MSSIQDKIDTFRLNCYEMATNDANKLSETIEEKINKNIKEEIELYKEEASRKYEKKYKKLEQSYNCQIFDEENMARHAIMDVEDTIKKDLKDTVTEQIKKFVNSEIYKSFLFKNISSAINKLNIENGNIIKINITGNDFNKYKDEIKDKFNFEVDAISNRNIGGSICINESKNISINNTLRILIEENL